MAQTMLTDHLATAARPRLILRDGTASERLMLALRAGEDEAFAGMAADLDAVQEIIDDLQAQLDLMRAHRQAAA